MVKKIKSSDLLPEFLQTDKNQKFLSSTIDQLIQNPSIERLDGFVGSKLSPNYNNADNYVKDVSPLRQNYQLSPSLIINDNEKVSSKVIGFDDLVNEIKFQGGYVNNFDRLFETEYYSYKPPIDWDKFVNYQEYYWLITGPQTVVITGAPQYTTSTFTVNETTTGDSFVFMPDGLTEDPLITLYRGNTYIFDINSSQGFLIKTAPSPGTDDIYNTNVTNNGTSTGKVILVVDNTTPAELYYVGSNSYNTQGQFVVRTIEQNTRIDVEKEILGKKNYTSNAGISLSNGMKIQFGGTVFPESYRNKQYFVEGVGESIKLVDYSLLTSSADMADVYNDNFDVTPFDTYPYDSFKTLPIDPEYITINRSSKDLNPWSRYNRWVHGDVIKISAEANGQIPVYPAKNRAKRPIIEFLPNLQLYNFGSRGLPNVDLIDTTTIDAFNTVNGSAGYYVDQVLLEQGHRVIFNADLDPQVKGKIYTVNYVIVNGRKTLTLTEDTSYILTGNEVISISYGAEYKGTNWWYNGSNWIYAQQHKILNESPLFDLFDTNGNSYSTDLNSDFRGNKVFGYTPGTIKDTVLGFNIKQETSSGIGSYSFKNFLMTESFGLIKNGIATETIKTYNTFLRTNLDSSPSYRNSWVSSFDYKIPIIQFTELTTSTAVIPIEAVDFSNATYVNFNVFVNSKKIDKTLYTITVTNKLYSINFNNSLSIGSLVLIKITTDGELIDTKGYYELPISITNNPDNEIINELTLSEISNHVQKIAETSADFIGKFPGNNNLRDLANIDGYANQIVTNVNPGLFSNFFIGSRDHNIIDALNIASDDYNQFKLSLIKQINEVSNETDPVIILDIALKNININKTENSPYYLSDMIAYGTDKNIKKWIVSSTTNKIYPLASDFDLNKITLKSILVYLNGLQLVVDKDYQFVNNSFIEILNDLTIGDTLLIVDYFSTEGSFVPATPTKLGLYPKFEPKIYLDDTYINGPINVVQGHDGSITIAFNDYRDDVILEYEKRVYNNIKVSYKHELLDFNSVIPGAFRNIEYSQQEINNILQNDFVKWSSLYGIEFEKNKNFNVDNPFTWNYRGTFNTTLEIPLTGYWRSVYKYFYDTDRPHTHPWEMLGFGVKPSWWDQEYGPAPYTSGNEILWNDLATGTIKDGIRKGIDKKYARPDLLKLLPVDEYGILVDPTNCIASDFVPFAQKQNFVFGDQGPEETAWRKSSYWPFVIQKLLVLTKPALYAALMYDISRLEKNIAGQWTYGQDQNFLSLKNSIVPFDKNNLTAGYSVYIVEAGRQKFINYRDKLLTDIKNYEISLIHKVGGFVGKNKLQIIIDAYDPLSKAPGAILPQEDYRLILNVSNPVKSIGISGIIIQKTNGKFLLKGYDNINPYFTVYTPIRNSNTPTITVGGVSAPYVEWSGSTSSGNTGLSDIDLTTANSAASRFYQKGQIVFYQNKFYVVKISHDPKPTFEAAYFQQIVSLPIKGGATVQTENSFDKKEKIIPYGTEFATLQEVYDVIIGYGAWLEDQGFIFDQFNSDLNDVLNWKFSAKEFLYWTTQNWANNNLIAISPFADQLRFKSTNSVVDNIFNPNYNIGLLQVNGTAFPQKSISIFRDDGTCTINAIDTVRGMYFVKLNLVQKEHVIIFNNTTIFNDTIYDAETGYRQLRVKFVGFRTKNWDGDYFSPGFIYDTVEPKLWKKYKIYKHGDVVKYNGKYYSSIKNSNSSNVFNFSDWVILNEQPKSDLLPNFDYKIRQFEDFYSLDIDNFDDAQQKMAQHLIGYTPRIYFNNIFTNAITQYKFYQGFIKEKGTKNSISKLAKASIQNLQGELIYNEVWAFRIGHYGSYETFKEIELPLIEGTFLDNPQIINFVDEKLTNPNDLIFYQTKNSLLIKPQDYVSSATFLTINSEFDDNNLKIKNAGYVRLDDITATAFNEASIFDIANNNTINQGNTFWLGFRNDGEWDVLRYNKQNFKLIEAYSNSDGTETTITTDKFHNLSTGDIVSILQLDNRINGVYKILRIVALDKFVISLEQTEIEIEKGSLTTPGILFKFSSQRFGTFNNFPLDSYILDTEYGTKFWVDKDIFNKWVVYEKIKNYDVSTQLKSTIYSADLNQFGFSLTRRKNNNLLFVGAPNYFFNSNYGKIYIYQEKLGQLTSFGAYTLNENKNYHVGGTKNEFGFVSFYDSKEFQGTGYGIVFVGAPGTSNVISDSSVGTVRISTGTGSISSYIQEGLVKINGIDPVLIRENTTATTVLLSPFPASYQRFGSSIYVQSNTSTKLTLIGAPGTLTTGSGSVYAYNVVTTQNNLQIIPAPSGITLTYSGSIYTGSQWGYSISGSDDAQVIAISAPGQNNQQGMVQIFNGATYNQTLTIPSNIEMGARFGEKVLVSPDGNELFVSAPFSLNTNNSLGKVLRYTKNSFGIFQLSQTIFNPINDQGMTFGSSIDLDDNILAVGALGTNNRIHTTFDVYSQPSNTLFVNDPNSETKSNSTTFDSASTTFNDSLTKTGSVFLYDNKDSKYVLVDEIYPRNYYEGNNYGHAVIVNKDSIYVGAPSYSTATNISSVYSFNKIDKNISGYKILRQQPDLIDVESFNRVALIDTNKEEIIDYLDIIDPIKGKISGLAEQELTFKSEYDPAVYSVGITSTINNSTSNWLDEHVGELWWDLSSTKYMWYEQGELTYRKNSWGNLFPGSTIDVYEWVRSEYLPSEWAALADTAAGLVDAVSGQPKYPDNSVVSIKQVLDPVTGTFINVYYFWVKNKVTVPNKINRRISAYQVASIIADPITYGIKTIQFISPDAISLANISNQLVDDKITLNISFDAINNEIPRHTEWLLLQENSESSFPNTLLEKKLIDSLVGNDRLGNLVPNPNLSFRERYGISIRPQQTMFKNKFEALRNIVDFVNTVLIKHPITDKCSFSNLNKQDEIPNASLNQYDIIVEDLDYLNLEVPNPSVLVTGSLKSYIRNGKIYNVTIENSGFGYRYPPLVTIENNDSKGAVITTEIDNFGKIVSVSIINAGQGFNTAPKLTVRPFTAIVLVDETANRQWAKYTYDSQINLWIKVATQRFNTQLYWTYVDWISNGFKPYLDFSYTLDDVYQLKTISDISTGEYIKIKNGGAGRYIIIEKTSSNELGTFDNDYNLVYSENGTIQITENIWNFINGNLNFDQNNRYDQTLYDQTPDIETYNIFTALKNDIFIDDLKINWNLLFFKAVKYALSEQKLLDWAFKTSFIDVINLAGELNQTSVYKLENTSYYEDYLKEVKPYHSVIRNYTTNYSKIEPSNTHVTDFDKPTVYNSNSKKFEIIDIGNALINEYPWKSWKDNYGYSIDNIIIADGGSGYTLAPSVTLETITGDTGYGATAKAFISGGKISKIQIINSGKNYTIPPNIVLTGGGDNPVPARTYALLTNEKIRKNKVGLKFDRISPTTTYSNNNVIDTFVCNGYTKEFILTWIAESDKLKFTVKLNDSLVLSSEYVVRYYSENANGYTNKFSKIVFLNYAPADGTILKIEYQKSISILHAAERIIAYYTSTNETIGKDLSQLMEGVEYPYNQLIGLPFDYTSKWDVEYQPFGQFAYGDDVNSSNVYTLKSIIGAGFNLMFLTTTTGITVGQNVNVISYITNKFNTSSVVTITSINTGLSAIYFDALLTSVLYPGDKVEIWSRNTNPSIIDTAIEGNNAWNTTTGFISNAIGISPENVNVSGDGFYTQNNLFATEELVPGIVSDTLGINVYTKSSLGAPLIFSGEAGAVPGEFTFIKLPFLPPSSEYITVIVNDQILIYNPNVEDPETDLFDPIQYAINWETETLIVARQNVPGKVGYTIVGFGNSESSVGAGLLDTQIKTVIDTNYVQIASVATVNSVGSAYVTVNGIALPKVTNPADIGYMLIESTDGNNKAAVNVRFFSYFNKNTVQVYFFSDPYKYFNEIKRQSFSVGGSPQTTFSLGYPPGISQPLSANVIVEVTDNIGTKKLLPPLIAYYDVTSSINTVFPINSYSYDNAKYNINNFDITNIKVYVNGKSLRPGFDFTVPFGSGNVDLNPAFINSGNLIAIECLTQGLTQDTQYDFSISSDTLTLENSVSDAVVSVITFNDHDGLLMRTERFTGTPSRRYKISRPVLNDNYVWVQVNGVSLTSGLDYEMLDDQVTVQISDVYDHTEDDEIVIISIGSKQFADTVLGYRMFNDIFSRTHFKRLSKNNTTTLTKELHFTDTEIYVADATVLTGPIPGKKIPGVILLDNERIEFFAQEGNVLKQLRRSTLGTAPSVYCSVGTKVIDQGVNQTIPYEETSRIQQQITTSSSIYTIFTTTNNINGDGIVLSAGINPIDQIKVYYGGRYLRKHGEYRQDIEKSFNTPKFNLKGTTATISLLPLNAIKSDAYLVTATNQVWIYTDSKKINSINGFEYTGLDYYPPEFSVNTSTQQLILNVVNGVKSGIKITIVKKDFRRDSSWNNEITTATTLSLLDSTTRQAKFLQMQPAELPNDYYYGGSIMLTDESEQPLLDNNGDPLEEGY